MYGNCTSYNGRIRENVGYGGVGLVRFHCNTVSSLYWEATIAHWATTKAPNLNRIIIEIANVI